MNKIEIPEGYEMPVDVKDGGTLEEVVTFKVEGEYLVPTKLAGIDLPKEDESKEDESTSEEETGVPEATNESPMKGMAARVMGMA